MSLFKSLILFAFILFPIVAVAEGDIREVTATGHAEVRVVPDEVVLSFAVETMNEDLNLAKQENDRIVKDALGIPGDQLHSGYISEYFHG
jgi:uncharacterized protein YggE